MKDKSVHLVQQPDEYFRELITQAMERRRISLGQEVEFYLVNLLNQFITTDKLYSVDEVSGEVKEEPLAIMMKDAIEHTEPSRQWELFRQVGDVSLYKAGFFQDSLNRKVVDVDYYIDMGGVAYQNVAVRSSENNHRVLYEELSDKFGAFVELLAEVSDQTSMKTEKEILRLYELWLRTGSERAAKALKEHGIIPNETIQKDWQ